VPYYPSDSVAAARAEPGGGRRTPYRDAHERTLRRRPGRAGAMMVFLFASKMHFLARTDFGRRF
jgi:hypothetical protein